MAKAQPIKNLEDIEKMKRYLIGSHRSRRNYILFIMGLYIPLRGGDLLKLRTKDFFHPNSLRAKSYLTVQEQKTGKVNRLFINEELRRELKDYVVEENLIDPDSYIFPSRKRGYHITTTQAYRILKTASLDLDIEEFSLHSLRKSAIYHMRKAGASVFILQKILNHSSTKTTEIYAGFSEEETIEYLKNMKY